MRLPFILAPVFHQHDYSFLMIYNGNAVTVTTDYDPVPAGQAYHVILAIRQSGLSPDLFISSAYL